MYKKIIEIIEHTHKQFDMNMDEVSYPNLLTKRKQLITLGEKIGCMAEEFEKAFSEMETTSKYSAYSSSEWGYYTPALLNEFIVTNVKKPKKLYKKPPGKFGKYYQYLFLNDELVMLRYFTDGSCRRTTYFVKVDNIAYSFCFHGIFEYQVKICQAMYNEFGKISQFSCLSTYGLPKTEVDEIVLDRCKKGAISALLDFQKYYYNEYGKLEYADKFSRIYEFLPNIIGLKLGKRFNFIYDETDKILGVQLDTETVPCVFEQ